MGEKRPMEQSEPEAQSKAARTAGSLAVGWFRNDLRLSDNPMLEELLEKAKANKLPAILVYIFDPRFYDKVSYGRVTDMEYKKINSHAEGWKRASRLLVAEVQRPARALLS
jgi:deoxyribodipyrimidine photolyase